MGSTLLEKLSRSSKFALKWDQAREHLQDRYSFDLNYLVKENPTNLAFRDARGEYRKNQRFQSGMINYTPFTQVALLAYHVAAYNMISDSMVPGTIVAGHSLGEISALAAHDIINFEKALDLVYCRGFLMSGCVQKDFRGNSPYKTYIVNPERCGIPESLFLTIIDVIADPLMKQRAEVLEITAYNVSTQQYVVIGTQVSLSVLGKILNPEWRRAYFNNTQENSDVLSSSSLNNSGEEIRGFKQVLRAALAEADINVKSIPSLELQFEAMIYDETLITGSVRKSKRMLRHQVMFMPRNRELDNEKKVLFTDSLDHELGLNEFAADGMRKRPWFHPVESTEIPFHSSVLNRALHEWSEALGSALPENEATYSALDYRCFIPNLLGAPLRKDKCSHDSLVEALEMDNIGETWTPCRSGFPRMTHSAPKPLYREMLHSLLTKHMVSAVQWSDTLRYILHNSKEKSGHIIEISPKRIFDRMMQAQAKIECTPPMQVKNIEGILLGQF